jgi:hypothetical protein
MKISVSGGSFATTSSGVEHVGWFRLVLFLFCWIDVVNVGASPLHEKVRDDIFRCVAPGHCLFMIINAGVYQLGL